MSRSITSTSLQTITVPSAAGFNAGDLVYFNGSTGDYGTPTPATQTAITVNGSKIQPLLGANIGSYTSPVDGVYGSCYTKSFAATLTNGNIVQVFINANTNEPSFRIVNAAGAVVVAVTSISITYTQSTTPNIAVTALTGGGFAVAWINNAGGTVTRPCFAVYDNAGTSVAAAAQDLGGTGIGVVTSGIRIAATPSGGFIIAYYSAASTIINARGYSAAGAAAFAWVGLSGVTTTGGIIGLAVRSSGDFILTGLATGNATGLYAIWSSVGAAVVASTTIPSTNGTWAAGFSFDACCLSNGTTFVIAYTLNQTAGGRTIGFRLVVANVVGPEFIIPSANITGGSLLTQNSFSITALSSNRFIVLATDSSTYSNSIYAVFNSSGVCLSGTSGTTSTAALPINIIGTYFTGATGSQPAVFEAASGLINIYYHWTSGKLYSLNQASISGTTYAVTLITPTATAKVVGVTAGQQAALYQPSVSTPLAAGFSITPGTYPVAYPFATVIKTPEAVDSLSAFHCSCTTLSDGRVLIAYIAATSLVKVAVYSVDGVLTQTLSIASNGTANTTFGSSAIDIAAMTGGGFVITFVTTTATVCNTYLYSSAFAQVGSVISITTASNTALIYPRVAGITGNRYVIAYIASGNQPTYEVYDGTNNAIVTATNIIATAHNYISVAALANGGFLISAYLVSTTTASYGTWGNPTGNTFTPVLAWAVGSGTANYISGIKVVSNSQGVAHLPLATAGTTYQSRSFTIAGTGGAVDFASGTLLNMSSNGGVAFGVTGMDVLIGTGVTTGPVLNIYSNASNSAALSATVFALRVDAQVALTSGYGPTVHLIYLDSSNILRYAIIADAFTQNATVASTDICTPISIYPGTTSASPAIQNTVLAGVALQTVPAGGAGAVQISGPTQLNSNYPAGTSYRTFDHQSQGVPGVKGAITGRVVTLQGT